MIRPHTNADDPSRDRKGAGSLHGHRSLTVAARKRRPRALVLYHYFHPDDVVSARQFAELSEGLVARGWDVEALPCNRSWNEAHSFPREELWQGVRIHRIWRPALRQASNIGRVLNAVWMFTAWCLALLRRRHDADVLILGTDPILSILVAPIARWIKPNLRIVHWCFDLYPEGPIAEGMLKSTGLPARLLKRMLRRAYGSCDLIVDIGGCMRDRLASYGHSCRKTTLVPWALAEPDDVPAPDPATRNELFGDKPLGLLYSGNFGRAHSFREFLGLARRLRSDGVQFCFGIRGNRADELRSALGPDDVNVSLAGFAPEEALVKRLTATDIHLVSLRPEWTGIVVPSKFFGALAVGRPVLFAGSRHSAIARWISEHGVGWVLDEESEASIADDLRRLATSPGDVRALQQHCQRVYREQFGRKKTMAAWDHELRSLLGFEAAWHTEKEMACDRPASELAACR